MRQKKIKGVDGVAIVGMAFRFPGGVADEEAYWTALKEGHDLVSQIGAERWACDALQHPKRSEPGRSITFSAGVLTRIDEFDAQFFGISPREAAWLDPQQRLLLELAWEAMENAGQVPSHMAGSDCAVYVGISGIDYGMRGLDDLASMSSHSMTGNTLSIAANRLSYVFDLHGPSMAVDTACSSSLVALHQACRTLQTGESSLALVGGMNLLLHPYPFVGFTKASMLSANGRCRAFDASGDGYVRSEGGAVLLLKPLSRAIADGDPIQAVILGSGVNADGGRKTGITIPSSAGQAELMRNVLRRAGVASESVDYVEAHGTGTVVGDPVETRAIGEVYGEHRSTPLLIGSAKTNLGHLEPASGMAGLVKTVLMLKHRSVPPSLHLDVPNPNIDFAGLNLQVATRLTSLPGKRHKPLVMGVNSFGFGGANAHVLLQEYRPSRKQPSRKEGLTPPLFLSARSAVALRAMAGSYAALLEDMTVDGYDLAYSAARHRQFLDLRLALHISDRATAASQLRQFADGESPPELIRETSPASSGKLAFIYSGNGSQWLGMGRKLLSESPRFASIITELDAAICGQAGFSILDEMQAARETSRLEDTAIAQPLLFALQVALTRLLNEQGVVPSGVAGHSVGEVAAAWASGALSLGQAVEVICQRSAAQAHTRGHGRMAAVGLSAEATAVMMESLGCTGLELAGINSPKNVTIAGPLPELERLRDELAKQGTFFRLLELDYAFHSRAMDPIRLDLEASLGELAPGQAVTPFISTVTGGELAGTALNAAYWWDNVRRPVRFQSAMRTLADMGCRIFVEIGPHAILQRYMAESLEGVEASFRIFPTLRRNDDGLMRLEEAALRILLSMPEPVIDAYFPVPGNSIRLPNYPWQRERHWHPQSNEAYALIERKREHPLLGWRLHDADMAWENTLDTQVLPWLGDHKVGGAVVFPGAAYAEMALAAAHAWRGNEHLLLEELDIVAPMVFDGEHARTIRFSLNQREGAFQITSRQRLSTDNWTLHAVGRILEAANARSPGRLEPLTGFAQEVDREMHYQLAAGLGLDYGPAFQGLLRARVVQHQLEAELDTQDKPRDGAAYYIHPAVLDICYQSVLDFFRADIEARHGVAFLPVRTGRLELYRRTTASAIRARLLRRGSRSVLADFELLDAEGQVFASISGCRFRAAPLLHREQGRISRWHIEPWLQPHPADKLKHELPSSEEIIEQLFGSFAARASSRQTWFKETLPLFEALSLSFAYEAFRSLADKDNTLPMQKDTAIPYVRWLAARLEQEGLLVGKDGCWQLESTDELPGAAEIWQALLRDAPACLPQLTLLGRIGTHLPALIGGERAVPEFIESLLRSPAFETLYDDDPAYLGSRHAVGDALRHLSDGWPAHRRLRVLEIAAGPSGLPRQLAGVLPEDRLDYVLAMTNEDMIQRQKAECHDCGNIVVARVDLSDWKLVSDQPMPAQFDVVVLRHTLHRATNPRGALAQAKRWLVPGGILLLAERYPDWSADFMAGIDPSWWHQDPAHQNGQPFSSLLEPEAWEQALRDEGFVDPARFTEPAAEGLPEGAYLLLAKRNEAEVISLPAPSNASWLLLADDASALFASHLRIRLESLSQHVAVAECLDKDVLADVDHVVYLRGWEQTAATANQLISGLLHDTQVIALCDGKPLRLWMITRGGGLASGLLATCTPNPAQAALWGFGRVVMNEYPGLNCTLVDLAGDPGDDDTLVRIENELLRPDGASEIILTARARLTLRMREDEVDITASPASGDQRFRLDFRVPGQLRNLAWLPDSERTLDDTAIEVRTEVTGLNFRDVMYLMGLLPDEAVERGFAGASLGLEFAGVVTRVGARVRDLLPGDAVMGFGASCFASHVVTRADAVAPMPEGWTFEAAATVPTVFFTVYYALKHLADLQPGERVLIHGGAGGVGIAAIQLARHLGAEIYATAGSDEKRDFVRLLGADHVFDSRSLSFADEILDITSGEGVDVVLNSLAGEAIRRNLRVLRPFGRFLELGKRDFFENTPIGLRPFKDNISYFGIDADQLLNGRPRLAARLFREVMALFREGVLAPLPYRSFKADQVVDAFRVMQQARHIGKIVVSLAESRPAVESRPEARGARVFEKASTWLVTGGLAGFGLESARWLAGRGVGNLVLLGRRGLKTPGAEDAIKRFSAAGVNVMALACDITDHDALAAVLERVRKTMPPLKGILHAAAGFDDRLIAKLDGQGIDKVLRPKLLGAWHLHTLTLDIPLDHFVLYSSVTTGIGNPGQANYVAANAGLEGLAELRRHMGLPVTCIGWGPIGDAGYLDRNQTVKESLGQRLGKPPLAAAEALACLDELLEDEHRSGMLANFDWGVLSRYLPSSSTLRFAMLNRAAGDIAPESDGDFRASLAGKTPQEVNDIVRQLVIQEVAQILRIAADRIEPQQSLHDLGMDSLMAVELALGLEQRFGIQLPVMMLNEAPTAEKVTARIVTKLLGSEEAAGNELADTLVEGLARQHGEEISREEIERMAVDARTLAENGARLIA